MTIPIEENEKPTGVVSSGEGTIDATIVNLQDPDTKPPKDSQKGTMFIDDDDDDYEIPPMMA